MYRILIVEDDMTIAYAVKKHMEGWGYEVICAENFKNVLADFAAFSPQLVLMDISLPFFNGYHWCSQIRQISQVPIIFISSAADNMNIVMAVNMGGDDFIAKPFDMTVLISKIQALLRRTYDFGAALPVLEHRGALLNTGDNTLTYRGEQIPLSRNEYRILLSLMESKGQVVSRERLMEKLWETDSFVDDNTVSVYIRRLREKIEADPSGPRHLVTVRGFGYRWNEE